MSRRIKTRTSEPHRGLCAWGVLLLTGIVMVMLGEPVGGVMAAGVDEQTSKMDVYYLSPKVLTRISMTPERLETDKSRVDNKDLPIPALTTLLAEIRSKSHQPTGKSRFSYDFRLCVVSDARSVCFSGDGTVGYASSEPFQLSTSERDSVLSLFKVLDARTTHSAEDTQSPNTLVHESGHADPPKPQ